MYPFTPIKDCTSTEAPLGVPLPPVFPPLVDGPDAPVVEGGAVAVGAAEPVVEVDVELSGPTKKKFPAKGLPSLTVEANVVKLKLFLGVDALTSARESSSKVEG